MPPARIHVATVGAPHGVRGELRLKPFTEDPLALKAYSPLESEDGTRRFAVLSARLQGHMIVAKLDGVSDRDQAAALTNTRLYVTRERLPKARRGEYYHTDLIGLSVRMQTGETIGTITAIQNFGAGDLLEIAREDRDTALVPFTEAFVPEIDVAAGHVVIAPPAGLLDDEAVNRDEEPG